MGKKEPPRTKTRRALEVFSALKEMYPEAGCSLVFHSPIELLIATILSAQCTDVQVNKVTPKLFLQCRNVEDFTRIPIEQLEELIRTTGFYHNKAKNIQNACREIIARFNGNVPDSMESLISLPGVGRKTANVVLSNGFGRNEGFVVDTHVFRLSHRLGFVGGNTPEKAEKELMQLFPQADWAYLSHALILHGRSLCQARKPHCNECPIQKDCPEGNRRR